jgi:hypothetical protein
MVEEVIQNKELLALIIKSNYENQGVHFFTPDNFSQQLAYMKHAAGKIIQPHLHNQVTREVHLTNEVLFIKKGKLRVDFYDNQKKYFKSCVLEKGDIILLSTGGHGFKVLEDLEMYEVKQGPYVGEKDKTRFIGIDELKIEVK